jgi:tRNA threonylcarbamoyladenosine biosynthesis protein TsaB
LANILIINSALETASVILSRDGEIVAELQNHSQKDHTSFLEPAIQQVCSTAHAGLQNIDAFAVVNGPGSYTGLRVGLSSAKALCYALQKPLILLNTLDVMAHALKSQAPVKQDNIIFCPLIDARRMEVYTALYDIDLNMVQSYKAMIVDDLFLKQESKTHLIIVGGSGTIKLKKILNNYNILCVDTLMLTKPAVVLSTGAFNKRNFADVGYSEPFYLKPVYFKNDKT